MVKVFPNANFGLFKNQRFVGSQHEPSAVDCSSEHVFIATKNATIDVYSLIESECTLSGQFSTISPVQNLMYNPKGDCIVTYEVRNYNAVRAYFNWNGASKSSKVNTRVIHYPCTADVPRLPEKSGNVEFLELNLSSNSSGHNVSLSCCKESGIFGVALSSSIRLFLPKEISPGYFDIAIFADIDLIFAIESLSISHNYISVASSSEALVFKWQVFGLSYPQFKEYHSLADSLEKKEDSNMGSAFVEDGHFVEWSAHQSFGLSSTSASKMGSREGSTVTSQVGSRSHSPALQQMAASSQHLSVPMVPHMAARQQAGIKVVSLKKVIKESLLSPKERDKLSPQNQKREVLGPVDHIRGIPVSFSYRSETRGRVEVNVVILFFKSNPHSLDRNQHFQSIRLMPLQSNGK